MRWTDMAQLKELEEYQQYTKPSELHKAVNTLRGLVAGMTTDRIASKEEVDELANWCMAHRHLINRHPFKELIPLIERVYEDGTVTDDEASDILWLCNNFVSDSDYYDLITSSIQFLQGLTHGIMADEEISDSEIHALQQWITTNEFLMGTYPFDEIESLLMTILMDGKVTEDERDMLKAFFSNFIDLQISYNLNELKLNAMKEKYSIEGICAVCQEIDFENSLFCFTGESERAKRNEIAELIESLGGEFKNNVTNKTKYLVVGNKGNPCWAFSCYGRKIEDAVNRRKAGQKLIIVNEVDFWDIVEDM